MMDNVNDREAKAQERRLGWAIFLSILFHLLFIFGISHFKHDTPKAENRVMTVRLVQDQLSVSQEKSGNKKNALKKTDSSAPQKQITPVKKIVSQKTEKKEMPNPKTTPVIPKPLNTKKTKTVQKRQETKIPAKQPEISKEVTKKRDDLLTEEKAEPEKNVPVVMEEIDVFNKFEKSQEEAKRQMEEDFFEDSENSSEVLPDFNFDDVLLADNSTSKKNKDLDGLGGDSSKDKDNDKSSNGKDIEWSSGGARGLLYSDAIDVPDDVKQAGLKFVIEIDFNVDADGYIRNSQIIKSSGNSVWDEDIRRQFCRWIFEKASDKEKSSGKIVITIAY